MQRLMTQDVERQSSVGFEFALPVQKHEEWTVDKPLQRHCLVPEFNDDGSLSAVTWVVFGVWMAVGLVFYFLYGYRRSRLAAPAPSEAK